MRTVLKFITLTLLASLSSFAQTKKDLIAEVSLLRNEITLTKNKLAESKKNETVCKTKLETTEAQMVTLRESNNSILSKMGSFTELSQKKANNLEKSLESIKNKDEQLNTINELLSKADSTKLATYSLFKNALGGVGEKEVKLSLSNGAVVIKIPNGFLFQTLNSANITETSKSIVLSKIANVLSAKQDLTFQVEGNSNELSFSNGAKDNWDLSSLQASAVIRAFQTEYTIDPKRMVVIGKSQYSTTGVETETTITILPKYDTFFEKVKESMKDK